MRNPATEIALATFRAGQADPGEGRGRQTSDHPSVERVRTRIWRNIKGFWTRRQVGRWCIAREGEPFGTGPRRRLVSPPRITSNSWWHFGCTVIW